MKDEILSINFIALDLKALLLYFVSVGLVLEGFTELSILLLEDFIAEFYILAILRKIFRVLI